MKQAEFFKILDAKLKNDRWSWGAVRQDGVVFLRVWQDQTQVRNGIEYVRLTRHEKGEENIRNHGYKERLRHVELAKEPNASCYLIMCEAVDVDATTRRVNSFLQEEIIPGGSLENWDGDWWMELRPKVPLQQVMLFRLPEEILPNVRYSEGAVQKILVNQYERNAKARKACLAHWKYTCVVCEFNFGHVYGGLAEGFIHVHHLKQLSEIGEQYEIDPISDLRPVCPNCHAVIHQNGGCRSIEEVKKMMEEAQNA